VKKKNKRPLITTNSNKVKPHFITRMSSTQNQFYLLI